MKKAECQDIQFGYSEPKVRCTWAVGLQGFTLMDGGILLLLLLLSLLLLLLLGIEKGGEQIWS